MFKLIALGLVAGAMVVCYQLNVDFVEFFVMLFSVWIIEKSLMEWWYVNTLLKTIKNFKESEKYTNDVENKIRKTEKDEK